MPTISEFLGIKIIMQFIEREHNPPHIHAVYGDSRASYDIKDIKLLAGNLPKRANAHVLEWIKLYQGELLKIWESQEFVKLPPLE